MYESENLEVGALMGVKLLIFSLEKNWRSGELTAY
jgi:hypothetical protein